MADSPYDVSPETEKTESPSSLSILTNIITTPGTAFSDMRVDYPVALPLIGIIALNALVVVLLYANIDFGWFIEHMVEAQGGDISNAEKDQMRQGMEMMSPTSMGIFGAISVAIVMLVIFCAYSLYYVIVSSITNDGFQFKQWLSFVTWTSIPSLIGTLASMVVVFMSSNGQISPETLNPLSLNALFFDFNAMEGVGNILASTDISIFWSIALMTIGYAKWTESSIGKSLGIVLVPYVIYYGIRILML
ncbi:hypothetical protein FLL45_11040 [Aliikangiella marina]|uniref:Yip1 domain-containing protein n=1 Tax=Aliikangiella marina TaxID=1712262 RepID=A0A545TE03_9GAMM|nr:YIP1 family protein [Aliikangiella marina]TQV75448.1 hypothetical protein FLL45_11040 [Aliikangiella marina]